jgi:hypothetical protein
MQKRYSFFFQIFFLVFIASNSIHSQSDSTRILFVGNSFTYFYNLPQVVASMAETQGKILITRQSTVGGSNLEQHWKSEKGTITRQLLEEGKWDFVVFNNHSRSSLDSPKDFMNYGSKFASLVRKKGAEPIFMVTWAYESDPTMQAEITRMHLKLSQSATAQYVPCGPILAKARTEWPDLGFFHDDKHPSETGTYLFGLAFYKFFTGGSTSEIPNRLTTTDKDGEKLYLIFMNQEVADNLQDLVDGFDFKIANELSKVSK